MFDVHVHVIKLSHRAELIVIVQFGCLCVGGWVCRWVGGWVHLLGCALVNFLPSRFFMIANYSVCDILYNLKILFTSSLKFWSLLYLSSASQLEVDCFITGLPSLGPTFCILSSPATVMACIAALVAPGTACTIAYWHMFLHLPLCICVLFFSCLPM